MSKTQQINTLQRLTVGQPTTIKASTWNAFVQHCESSSNDDLPPVKSNDNSTVIICKNTSGSTISPFTVVAISDFTPNPAWQTGENFWQRMGVAYQSTPTITNTWNEKAIVGIAQQEIADGEAGYVLISGFSPLYMPTAKLYGSYDASYTSYIIPCSNGFLLKTRVFGPIRIIKSIGGTSSNCLYVHLNPPFYDDYNILGIDWTFDTTTVDNVVSHSITITTQQRYAFIYDGYNHRYTKKQMPAMTLTTTGNGLSYGSVYIRFNIQTEEFDLINLWPEDGYNLDFTTYAYVPIGFIQGYRYVNTINSAPIFVCYDSTQYEDTVGFKLYLPSLSDRWTRVLVSKGYANVPAKDKTNYGTSSFNGGGTLEKDCFNHNFITGNKYVVIFKYTFSSDSFSFLAVPWSDAFDQDFRPATTHAVATIGMFCYRKYIKQWHHGASLSLDWVYSKYDNA